MGGNEGAYSDPMYCIAAHVPAIKAPGLQRQQASIYGYRMTPSNRDPSYLDPDKLGLPYTPPVPSWNAFSNMRRWETSSKNVPVQCGVT